jgi:hypothetical protein
MKRRPLLKRDIDRAAELAQLGLTVRLEPDGAMVIGPAVDNRPPPRPSSIEEWRLRTANESKAPRRQLRHEETR